MKRHPATKFNVFIHEKYEVTMQLHDHFLTKFDWSWRKTLKKEMVVEVIVGRKHCCGGNA